MHFSNLLSACLKTLIYLTKTFLEIPSSAPYFFLPYLFAGWTVKSKTSFNKISPVTVLGHSYLLNSEGKF